MVWTRTAPAAVDKPMCEASHTANADSGVTEIPHRKPEID
jgi:hypothetical protein